MIMYSIKWRTVEPINNNPSWDSIPVTMCGFISAASADVLKRDMEKYKQKYGNVVFEDMEVHTL